MAGFTDVGFGTAHAKEHVDNIFCLTIHRLLNDKNVPIFHLDVCSFYDIGAALAVMTCIIAFRYLELFWRHRKVRVCQKEFQTRRLTTARDYGCLIHDEFHFGAFIENIHTFCYPREYVGILWIVCVHEGKNRILIVFGFIISGRRSSFWLRDLAREIASSTIADG